MRLLPESGFISVIVLETCPRYYEIAPAVAFCLMPLFADCEGSRRSNSKSFSNAPVGKKWLIRRHPPLLNPPLVPSDNTPGSRVGRLIGTVPGYISRDWPGWPLPGSSSTFCKGGCSGNRV